MGHGGVFTLRNMEFHFLLSGFGEKTTRIVFYTLFKNLLFNQTNLPSNLKLIKINVTLD